MNVLRTITTTALACLVTIGPFAPAAPAYAQKAGGLVPTAPPVGPPRPFKLPLVREKTLANGLRVLFIEDHKQPVVSLSVMVRSGAATESPDRAGLAQLTAALLNKGTESRTAKQIAEEIDSAGGSLGASASWDSSSASTTVLANRTDQAANLLADILIRPAFKAEELDRERSQRLGGLQVSFADAGFVADLVFEKVVLGASPYAHPIAGTPDTLKAITRDDIAAFHKTRYVPNNATLAIVGDLDQAAAFAMAEKHFGAWAKGGEPPAPAKAGPAPAGKLRIIVLDKPDAAQTEIRAGLPGITRTDPEYFTAIVANAVFGGTPFSSRIEQELRVKRGLTYGANSRFDARMLGGTFEIATNTKTETTAEAVRVILDEVARIRAGDVPAEELKARKDFLTGVFALSLETPDAVASRLLTAELYGLGKTYLDTYSQRVTAVTAADVRRIVSARIDPGQFVIVLAGNAAAFEDKVREFGPVEKVPFDEVDVMGEGLRRAKQATAAVSAGDAKAAEDLVNRTIEALGGDRYMNQKSQVLKGTGTLTPAPGQSFPITEIKDYRVYPNKARTDISAAGFLIRNGFNGDVGWQDRPGAGLVDSTAQAKLTLNYGLAILRRFRAGGVTARPLADAEVDGKAVKAFALADAEGHDTTFYVDATTFLPVKLTFTLPQGDFANVFADYKDFSGVKVPTTQELWIQGNRIISTTYTDVQVNTDVDPALFEKPAN